MGESSSLESFYVAFYLVVVIVVCCTISPSFPTGIHRPSSPCDTDCVMLAIYHGFNPSHSRC